MRSRNLDKLRSKKYDGSSEDWKSILTYGLVSKETDLDQAVKDNLEIQCSVSGKDPKATLSISFSTRVKDITQHLGSVELSQTEDTDDIDLFGWAVQLAVRRDALEIEVTEQKQRADAEAKKTAALQKQLDDLIKAKEEHEEELLAKFAMLLNAKKHELRRLSRVLKDGKVDPALLKDMENSSKGKRGQKRAADASGSEEEESDGFEDARPPVAQAGDDEQDDQTTGSEDTASEDAGDLDRPVHSQTEAGSSGTSKQAMPDRRELPFKKQTKKIPDKPVTRQHEAAAAPAEASKGDEDDEETASEDDEL